MISENRSKLNKNGILRTYSVKMPEISCETNGSLTAQIRDLCEGEKAGRVAEGGTEAFQAR